MSAWDGLNRRRFPRAQYPCMVIVKLQEGSKETILTHTENLGTGGVCVIIKQQIKLFAPVEIEVDLMDMEEHLKCRGKVVWSVRRKSEEKTKPLFYDVGIEFVDIEDKDLKRVQKIIQHLVQRQERILPNL